ncbi:MAG: hypothetical protein ACP5O6_04040 [Candidatus Baltobacteraceae bacterium]
MKLNNIIRSAVFSIVALAMVGALCAPALAAKYTLTVENYMPYPVSITTSRQFCMRSPLPAGRIQPHSKHNITIDTDVSGGCSNPFLASELILEFKGGDHVIRVDLSKRALLPWEAASSDRKNVHLLTAWGGAAIILGNDPNIDRYIPNY